MKQQQLPEIYPADHFLGFYHDGISYKAVKWNNIVPEKFYCYSDKYDKIEYKIDIQIPQSALTGLYYYFLTNRQIHIFHKDGKLILAGSIFISHTLSDHPSNYFYFNIGKDYSIIADVSDEFNYESCEVFSSKKTRKDYEDSLYFNYQTLPFDNDAYRVILHGGLIASALIPDTIVLKYDKPKPNTGRKFTYIHDSICYYNQNTIYVYQIINDILVRIKKISSKDPIVDVKYSPDGKILLVISKSKIYLYNTDGYTLLKTMIVQEGRMTNGLKFCAWATDGLTFGVCSNKIIYSFDLDI